MTTLAHDAHAATCPVPCCTSADDPAVTGRHPLTQRWAAEAVAEVIWEDLDDDPTRVGDLLAIAVEHLVELATANRPDSEYAAQVLGRIERRALWGPPLPAGPTTQELNP